MASCDIMLSVKYSPLFKIKKHWKYQMCAMDLVSCRGITLILIDRPAIQLVCLFDVYTYVPFHLMA